MASIRDQILDYIVEQIDAIPGVIAARSRLAPVRRSEGTRVIVTWTGETSTPGFHDQVDRVLEVRISILATGDIPDQVADATAVKVYAKLNSTQTIATMGGLAYTPLIETSRTPEMEDADNGAIDYQIFFEVRYWTTVASETTQP